MEEQDILNLIEKFHTKTISPEELKKLRELFDAPQHSKVLLRLMRNEFEEVSSSDTLPAYKNEKAIQARLVKHLKNERKHSAKNNYYWIAGVAAVCMIIGFLFLSRNQPDTVTEPEWATIYTKHGERKKITLSDGTHILLNGNTSLSYPQQISDRFRLVKLNGEAFFDVAKNEKKPFLIVSKDFTTQVVGTSFNLDTDIGKNIEVNTGIVHIFALQGHQALQLLSESEQTSEAILSQIEKTAQAKAVLQQGKKARLNDDHTWSTAPYNYKNWIDNEHVYLNEPLYQVVRKAYRNYGDSIAIHPDLVNKNITITFKNKQKEQVLNTLTELCNGKLRKNQTTGNWEITK